MENLMVQKEDRRSILPICSICGDDATVTLRVEMPGVSKDDIEVKIDGNQLLLTGKLPDESGTGTWLLRERHRGNYERSFTIDNTIDRDHIDAVFELGVMTLTLHVKDEVKPRRIEITGK